MAWPPETGVAPAGAHHVARTLKAEGRISGQHSVDHIPQQRWRIRAPFLQRRWRLGKAPHQHHRGGGSGERRLPGEHLVRDDPERVDVGSVVTAFARHLLRAQIRRSPHSIPVAVSELPSAVRAMPKSVTSDRPVSDSISTLCGLMSRWMTPRLWA